MNRLGILMDVSHASYQGVLEAIEISQAPVVVSHSNLLSLCNTSHSIPDKLIQKVAQKGSIIEIAMYPAMLKEK